MMHGRNNGKKIMAMRIVKHAFEIIHLLTGEVGVGNLTIGLDNAIQISVMEKVINRSFD